MKHFIKISLLKQEGLEFILFQKILLNFGHIVSGGQCEKNDEYPERYYENIVTRSIIFIYIC